mgnify:CR=1 FL=1
MSTVADKIKGVANRGNLNWSGSNTTASVLAGYYTGGTLDSRPSYNNGYSSGRSQGQSDVKNSPNSYSLYTKSQYDANWNSGRTQGQNDVKNSPNSYGLYTKAQYDANWNNGYNSGKSVFYIKTGSYNTNANNKLNGHRAITILNIGITPKLAIMWFGASGYLWIYNNSIYINCVSKNYSSYVQSFSSSNIRVDTDTTNNHTWNYVVAGY